MAKKDYADIGLKSGLEIHQQLDTNKLFCDCPSLLRSDEPERVIERKLNPVVGETGEIDVAVAHEKEKDKKFLYQVYDTNCLVELDEEPPHDINQEALEIALQISLLLNCKIFPVTQVMRKTVIDGSNTTGFQRTALIAHDGYIEISAGKIAIDAVMLEEDSARPAPNAEGYADRRGEEDENSKTYKLDRLGIPLVEIATGPHMHTPEAIKEAALKIGEILRACKVKRGIGTIRQDVNISIKGSERVEIKGFQDPKMMMTTIDKEIERQQECVKNKTCRNEVRGALPDGSSKFQRPMPGAARMYPETDVPLLKIPKKLIDHVRKNLPKLASEHKSYLKDFGLNDEMMALLLKQRKIEEFSDLAKIIDNPNLVAKALALFPKELSKKSGESMESIDKVLDADVLGAILENVSKGKISENDVKTVMGKIVAGESISEAMAKSDVDLAGEVEKLIKDKPGLSQGAYMGLIMGKFKGKVSGKEVSEELRKVMK
ncbi:Glu-tRNA(Gln) amidotransferase subunit GatE [archaeon]|jgi:Glu-tRNA(Gln) amidotransferase subunit E-like FAD-binding protein|nr:Glu-tRNA(Gln) amidotransferase subunit GatE [archaeon]MBT3577382.1 Glu-tRNA(Gln) amidotransferase subunit GatE [archaeon]MBT6820375.1 Glu-tRNA(Gln) amidotransferase subunit GatE [archaeon]MBT6956150.1 Glu-tRNA(Gln) amidotransferase subunit GatE [archaeon]MBT7025189.1 Glu-tRNA(Gln) amidotransferase subunit GatE [archaeon]